MWTQGWVRRTAAAAWLMSRPDRRVVTMAWCALLSACGSTSPSSATLDGQWSGTTSQGTPIAFTVSSDQRVTVISVGYSFNGCSGMQTFSDLSLETAPMVTCIPGPCPTPVSSYRAFNYSSGRLAGPTTTINGLFTLMTRAEGQVGFRDYPGCGTAIGIGWTANKR